MERIGLSEDKDFTDFRFYMMLKLVYYIWNNWLIY